MKSNISQFSLIDYPILNNLTLNKLQATVSVIYYIIYLYRSVLNQFRLLFSLNNFNINNTSIRQNASFKSNIVYRNYLFFR